MSRTTSPARRNQILKVSASRFARQGYHRTSVSDIIRDAGIARGTFYLYFKSKHDVFEVLLDHFLASLKDAIRVIEVDSPVHPVDQLRENLSRAMQVVDKYRDVARVLMGSLDAPDRQVRSRVDFFFKDVKVMVASSIRTGKELGLVRGVREETAVHFAFGAAREVVREMVASGSAGRGRGSSRRKAYFDALADELVRLAAFGLLTDLAAAAFPPDVHAGGRHG